MGILTRLMPWRAPKDPYWDGFISKPLADADNDLIPSIRGAAEGRVFPVLSEVPPPDRMSTDLAELARFLGALDMGVATTDAAYLESAEDRDALIAAHPFVVMCTVHAEYDPAIEKGMGGQHPVQESASINFSLSAYIRELGYRSTVRPVDSVAVAVAAGLGTADAKGRLASAGHGTHVYVGDGVLTDLPLALGAR